MYGQWLKQKNISIFKYTACDGNEYVYVGTFSNIIYAIQRMTQFDFSYLYKNWDSSLVVVGKMTIITNI